MPRRKERARPTVDRRSSAAHAPDFDAPAEALAPLPQRGELGQPELLERLRVELRICSPALYVRLIRGDKDEPSYLHVARGRKDEQIVIGDGAYQWKSTGLEAGIPEETATAARAVAKFMGAPVRSI